MNNKTFSSNHHVGYDGLYINGKFIEEGNWSEIQAMEKINFYVQNGTPLEDIQIQYKPSEG